MLLLLLGLIEAGGLEPLLASQPSLAELFVDTQHPGESIDMTRYSLGQGGLSHQPMFDLHLDQVATLRPKTIRLFVQEYFNLYPAKGRYHWETLDRSIETILATGAKPLLCLCFKPRVLYPATDQDVVHPTDYAEWEQLIEAMVRHCNLEKKYGVEYWEIGNEVDIGEDGGCPYRFRPRDYVQYYSHTAAAILRADPSVKVGGPALANHTSPIGDALIEFCGEGGAPLHFFSWHIYGNDPLAVRKTIRTIKQKLARYPRLSGTETVLDEWNIGLLGNERAPGFQAAFVLETSAGFLTEGLSMSSYYHIRDHYVAFEDFNWMSPSGYKFMSDWWNIQVQNSGLFDKQGRRRPAYFAFQMLARLKGQKLPVDGATNSVHALAVRHGSNTHLVFWNYPETREPSTAEIVVRFPSHQPGQFRLAQLNVASNRLETTRMGPAFDLEAHPVQVRLAPYGVAWLQLGEFKIHASWGHQAVSPKPFYIEVESSPGLSITNWKAQQMESGDQRMGNKIKTRAGGGDLDAAEFQLLFGSLTNQPERKEQSLWTMLLKDSDPDTAQRLNQDPAFRINPPSLTFKLNPDGTRGFTVALEQLLGNEAMWIPSADLFLTLDELRMDYASFHLSLKPLESRSVLDTLHNKPESSYAEFTNHWEDMGNPSYKNPFASPPGHVVGITWDSALPKFGIDRNGGAINDLGTAERFRLNYDFGPTTWKNQSLKEGLPVITTLFEKDGVEYQLEQFAYPVLGPPPDRHGDISMALFQKVTATNQTGLPKRLAFTVHLEREFSSTNFVEFKGSKSVPGWVFEESLSNRCAFYAQGEDTEIKYSQSPGGIDAKRGTLTQQLDTKISGELPGKTRKEILLILPSPLVNEAERNDFLRLNYEQAKESTMKFWEEYLHRGAVFRVPEQTVNEMYRASLWHALRLPRRHGGSAGKVAIDLPYSNFAYSQTGTPWPVNQSVYVDNLLYDLRGYHDLSHEELLTIYGNNQEPDGRVGGFANWGVYTPAMLYSVAQHYLLSHDRAAFEELLPPSLRALDWCLSQIREAAHREGPAQGLILAPLNDLSHEPRAWAFNQAYFYSGIDLFADALTQLHHPRARECKNAALNFRKTIEFGYSRATTRACLVQLADHTWNPYVPSDALTPRRLVELWYPTDVDTGPLHLSRLRALPAQSGLTTAMLRDHEDNLFYRQLAMADEPVYVQHGIAYLLRDDPEAAIRAFYSLMACGFSHTVYEPVEHRWGWGQYFGPPSTDGAWFELYRKMLIHEQEGQSLILGQATPRAWLQDGNTIEVQRAPSYYGLISMTIQSRANSGFIRATVDRERVNNLNSLIIRLRHPEKKRMNSVKVNGKRWTDFEAAAELIRIPKPKQQHYLVEAFYEQNRN